MKPYIGITGVATEVSARRIARLVDEDASHALMVGYAMTPGSLNEVPKSPRYVTLRQLPSLLLHTWRAFNVIHYSAEEQGRVREDLTRILKHKEIYARGWCQTVQVNTPFPEAEMYKLKNRFPKLRCIVPLNTVPTREQLAPTLQHLFAYPADAFLIDTSRGTGTLFDIATAAQFYRNLREVTKLPGGFAGGFTPENVAERVTELFERVREPFSIDAEYGLLTDGMSDPEKIECYVREARRAFEAAPGTAATLLSGAAR